MRTHSPYFRLPPVSRRLLATLFLLHAALGAALGLSVDEAHYALYAQHLALSYFDHPPLVGWIQWPLVALNAPDVVLRLIPGALWLATVWLVHGVAQQLQAAAPAQPGALAANGAPVVNPAVPLRASAGFWAVLVLLLAPLLHVLGIGLLPDTLLMFFSVALMALTLRMTAAQSHPAPWHWLLLGALLGLAGLGKYTAIFSALAVVACLLAAHGVKLLRSPWPWVALVLALLIVSPVAIWNARNGWISFAYQSQHGSGDAWQGSNLLRFALVQMLAFGPLLWWGASGLRRSAPGFRMLGLFFAIPFAVTLALSGGGSGLPHWTAPAWVALAPFAGLALARPQSAGVRWAVGTLALLQGVACVVLVGLMLSGGMPFFSGQSASAESSNPPNPFADLHGWDAAGARARQLAQSRSLDSVSVQNWTLASRIGWYARPLKVHVLQDRFDQFDLWAGKLPVGAGTLLVDWSQQPYVTPLGQHGFARCEWLDTVQVTRLGFTVAHFDLYACSGWAGDPQPALKPRAVAAP